MTAAVVRRNLATSFARSLSRMVLFKDLPALAIERLLGPHGLELCSVAPGTAIPGSYWGEPEAGLIRNRLYVRADTPVHSALHEACHYLCMDEARRAQLDRDAGGSDTEENAVCYLQCLLAPQLEGYSRERLFADMDAWGYHFLLGSAQAWFEHDAEDARDWLNRRGMLSSGLPTPFDASKER